MRTCQATSHGKLRSLSWARVKDDSEGEVIFLAPSAGSLIMSKNWILITSSFALQTVTVHRRSVFRVFAKGVGMCRERCLEKK